MDVLCTVAALMDVNQFLPTIPTFAVRETGVSRHNGGTSGAPLKPLRDDSALCFAVAADGRVQARLRALRRAARRPRAVLPGAVRRADQGGAPGGDDDPGRRGGFGQGRGRRHAPGPKPRRVRVHEQVCARRSHVGINNIYIQGFVIFKIFFLGI